MTKPVSQSESAKSGASTTPPTSPAADTAVEPAPRSLRVLVAEDGLVNRQVVLGLLNLRGHHVDAVADGREAVAAWQQDRHDVILMDVQMPEMDGFEATSTIRRMEQATKGHVPIIAMTANATEADQVQCRNAGMDSCIAKPVERDTLYAIIENACGCGCADDVASDNRTSRMAEPTPQAVFDFEEAMHRIPGGMVAVRALIPTLREEISTQLAHIRKALDQQDSPLAVRGAHTIKSSAAAFAAASVVEAADVLEQQCREENLAAAAQSLKDLEQEVRRLDDALQSAVNDAVNDG